MRKKAGYISLMVGMITVLLFCLPVWAVTEEEMANRSAYDSREYSIITPVTDQGGSTLCWAFSAISAAEASVLKSGSAPGETAQTLKLSPWQVGYARHNRGTDPLGNTSGEVTGKDWYSANGQSSDAQALFSQWCGPVDGSCPETCDGWENARFILKESPSFDGSALKTDPEARLELKRAIVKYGAVTFSYNNLRETEYYNPAGESGGKSSPHACTIIGWDDNIPASRFQPKAAGQDGGWLIKNSYSSLPYFYLSYDNTSSNIYAFSFLNREAYDYNYFYDADGADFGLGSILRPQQAANVFEAKKGSEQGAELVSAVNAGFEGKNVTLRVKVYKNLRDASDPTGGVLAAEEEVFLECAGYYTVPLSVPVQVEKGSLFSVVAEVKGEGNTHFKLTGNQGKSFFYRGGVWRVVDYAPRLKAFTKVEKEKIYFADGYACLNASEGERGIFMLGLYREDNLLDCQMISAENSGSCRLAIPKAWQKQGDRVKAFFWNSFEEMKPFACEERRINEIYP